MGFQNTIIKLLTSKDLDLSEYLKTTDADSKYAAKDHNHSGVYAPAVHTHTTDQITNLADWAKQPSKPSYTYSEVGAAAASHTHEISQVNGLQNEINSLKTSGSEGKSLIASAITAKGISTASDATFQQMANNIGAIETNESRSYVYLTGLVNSTTVNDYYNLGRTSDAIWLVSNDYDIYMRPDDTTKLYARILNPVEVVMRDIYKGLRSGTYLNKYIMIKHDRYLYNGYYMVELMFSSSSHTDMYRLISTEMMNNGQTAVTIPKFNLSSSGFITKDSNIGDVYYERSGSGYIAYFRCTTNPMIPG